jgi:hypothetical protein
MIDVFYFTTIINIDCPRHEKPTDETICSLKQMIVKINTDEKSFMVTFISNIRIPYLKCKNDTHHVHGEQNKNINNTMSYQYIDGVEQSSFNIKLLDGSLSDDELESFGPHINMFCEIFKLRGNSDNVNYITYILKTTYKNSYISKKELIERHVPNICNDYIQCVTREYNDYSDHRFTTQKNICYAPTNYYNRNVIMIYNLKSKAKAKYMQNAIITKLIGLYVDYHVNPLFDKHNSIYSQKPNSHVDMKNKIK